MLVVQGELLLAGVGPVVFRLIVARFFVLQFLQFALALFFLLLLFIVFALPLGKCVLIFRHNHPRILRVASPTPTPGPVLSPVSIIR